MIMKAVVFLFIFCKFGGGRAYGWEGRLVYIRQFCLEIMHVTISETNKILQWFMERQVVMFLKRK